MNAPPLRDVVAYLRERRVEARDRFCVEFIGACESTVLDEEGKSKPIFEVVMEVVGPTTYFRLGDLQTDLEEQFGRRVDLVDRRHLRPALREIIERDMIEVGTA